MKSEFQCRVKFHRGLKFSVFLNEIRKSMLGIFWTLVFQKSRISFCIIVDVSYANTYTDVMISVCRQEDVESIKEEKDAQGIK